MQNFFIASVSNVKELELILQAEIEWCRGM